MTIDQSSPGVSIVNPLNIRSADSSHTPTPVRQEPTPSSIKHAKKVPLLTKLVLSPQPIYRPASPATHATTTTIITPGDRAALIPVPTKRLYHLTRTGGTAAGPQTSLNTTQTTSVMVPHHQTLTITTTTVTTTTTSSAGQLKLPLVPNISPFRPSPSISPISSAGSFPSTTPPRHRMPACDVTAGGMLDTSSEVKAEPFAVEGMSYQ